MMNATKPTNGTKTQIKSATTRVATLETELASEYTKSLGRAAENCVRQELNTAKMQLAWLICPRDFSWA